MDLPPPPPGYEQTIQAIKGCGVAASKIHIKYEDYLQSDEVTISDMGNVTDAKLRCIRNAVHPFYILKLEKLEQQAAFHDLQWKDARPEQLREARSWVESRGQTARIPVFSESDGVVSFARALERSCDLKAGSIFVVDGSHFPALQPEHYREPDFERSAKVLECVTNMFAASNASEHGIHFGFIGNEALSPEDEKK